MAETIKITGLESNKLTKYEQDALVVFLNALSKEEDGKEKRDIYIDYWNGEFYFKHPDYDPTSFESQIR